MLSEKGGLRVRTEKWNLYHYPVFIPCLGLKSELLEGEWSFWRVLGHQSPGMKSSALTFSPRLLTSFYKAKYLFSKESVRRFSSVKCPCIQKNWHLCSLNQFPKIMQHILMVLWGPTARVSEKWGWTFYMSPKQINLCPAPSEKIIKQSVTRSDGRDCHNSRGGICSNSDGLPPSHLGLILTQSDHSSRDAQFHNIWRI